MDIEGQKIIRVVSRKNELALIQTNYVIDCLKKVYPNVEFKIVTMTTLGDRILNVSLPKIGEKALFTKDLEDALRNNSVDFVVHSLKDLPTTLPEGLAIGAILEREDPRDALILREDLKGFTLATLPEGSVIGTSSLRRTAQLRAGHAQLRVADVRGNLNTRLAKLDRGGYAALLLAASGVRRMGWAARISATLPCSEMLYAVGQGALAVECRADRAGLLAALAAPAHPATYCRVLAERSFLRALGGGCSAPVGVSTSLKPHESGHRLVINGAVWSLDGAVRIHHTLERTLPSIFKTAKHKHSPEPDEGGSKKLKTEADNPIGALNEKLTEAAGDLNCEPQCCQLFCGMAPCDAVPMDVIVECEAIGKELADALIGKGALEVMKVTQDYIRSSIVKDS